jgi:MFS family permease
VHEIALGKSRHYGLLLVVIAYAELVAGFETGMIFTALAVFIRIFGDPIGVGWLLTGYLLVGAAAAAICARLGDIFGRRRVLLWMLALCTAGSLIAAFATDLRWVIVGRAVQGAAAAVMPLCFGLVRQHLPAEKVPLGIGIVACAAGIGSGSGVLIGGYIVDNFEWHTLFFFSAGAIALAIALVALALPASPRATLTAPLDAVGGLLFVPALASVLLGVTNASRWGWLDARTLALLLGGIALLMYWVRYELKHEDPLIDVRLLGKRQILLANLGMAFAAFGTMQIQVVTLLLQQPAWTLVGLGVTATVAGLAKVPGNIGSALAATLSGRQAGRRGGRVALLTGAIICALGWTGLLIHHASLWFVVTCIIVIGFGTGYLYAAIPNTVVEVAPVNRTSEATGLSAVVRTTFQAIGSQIMAVALASSTLSDPAQGKGVYPDASAYALVFALIIVSCIGCIVCAFFLPRREPVATLMEAGPDPQGG